MNDKVFESQTTENGYVIYRHGRLLPHWEVEELLNKLHLRELERYKTYSMVKTYYKNKKTNDTN